MTEYVLDLGEDGEIVVVSADAEDEGIVQAGLGDDAKRIYVNAKEGIGNRLRGLGKLFVTALPPLDNENFELEEFKIEFDLGLSAEIGTSAGASGSTTASVPGVAGAAASADVTGVAKIVPGGNFKCSYTWKRKQPSSSKTAADVVDGAKGSITTQ